VCPVTVSTSDPASATGEARPGLTPRALQDVRLQRAGLHDAMVALEGALAAPMPGRVGAWGLAVHHALADLASAFERHLAVTEGSHGLFRDIIASAPRLSRAARDVQSEHELIGAQIREVTTAARMLDPVPEAATALREATVELVATLARHRQKGADLVYDAYSTDIGGSE
jgi:hypothetical protein